MDKNIVFEFNKDFCKLIVVDRVILTSSMKNGQRYFLFSNNFSEQRQLLPYGGNSSISEIFGDSFNYDNDLLEKNFYFGECIPPILEDIYISNRDNLEYTSYLKKIISADQSKTNYIDSIYNINFLMFILENKKSKINKHNIERVFEILNPYDNALPILTNLSNYHKSFINKVENKLTVANFLVHKFPLKKDQIYTSLKINKVDSIQKTSVSLLSCKYDKKNLYSMFPVSYPNNFDKDLYWSNLNLVSDFLNNNKEKYGINYIIFDGYNDKSSFFNLIIEKNENFSHKDEAFYNATLKVFELFKDYPKRYCLSSVDISNADKVYNYYLFKNDLVNDKKSTNKNKI